MSRNPIDSATIQWLLQQEKINAIQTADRQYLPSDNVLLFSVESGMANQYILDLSKNVKRGIVAKLEKGGYPNYAPMGYVNNKLEKTIEINRSQAKYIRKGFELYATGNYSLNDITQILYDEGFRTRGGKKVYKSKIHFMLSDPVYAGIIEMRGKRYLGNHEAIISKRLFEKAEQVRQKVMRPKAKRLHFMYRGVLQCEKCGCMMTATEKKQKHTYYYCTNGKKKCDEHKSYLKEDYVSEEMTKIFEELKFDEEFIEKCYLAKKEKLGQDDDYYENIKKDLEERLKAVKKRKNALLDLFIDGDIEKSIYDEKLKNLENEKVEIMSGRKEIDSKIGEQGEITLERTKELFMYPVYWSKCFLEYKDEKKRRSREKVTLERHIYQQKNR